MIAGINESKILSKHISWECKCRFGRKKCNSNQQWNSGKCWYECKKHNLSEKNYIWDPVTCSCKNGKYSANVMEDSGITCDGIIEPYDEKTKAVPTNFTEKK